jgi:hypothetical protein
MPLLDTTLRSVVFGKTSVEVVPGPGGQVLKERVSPDQFKTYEHVLKVMAQLSRIVYCDSAVAEEVLKSPVFGGFDNKLVNDLITSTDKKWSPMRRKPVGTSGRPMQSYVGPASSKSGPGMARYVSTPDDVTFLALSGQALSAKLSFFQPGDLILTFKGSSTVDNFKHDLYSQFTRAEISPNNFVPGSFLKHIKENWSVVKAAIADFNPTRLFISGHSLGGAYATLCAYLLLLEGYGAPIHLVTFGSPTIVADAARNEFNAFLDSGKITLDRVTSAYLGKIADVIPAVPAGFSHPGFQPLRTEFYPESKTGRAYNFDTIRKVYQGGAVWSGPEKKKYEALTMTHMPNKVGVTSSVPFAHAGYLDMTFLGAMRLPGMKNPGFPGNTFVADIYDDGMKFAYTPSAVKEASPEATSDASLDKAGTPPTSGEGGRRRTMRNRKRGTRTMRKY